MSANPAPRPALRKATDASVHPGAPRLVGLAVELDTTGTADRAGRAADGKRKRGDRKRGSRADGLPLVGPKDKTVDVVVTLPKAMRKRLKAKAAEHGFTPEEATFHLLRVWLDG